MNAAKCTSNKKNTKSQSGHQETKNSKRLETRRRIEDIYEEKRLRSEFDLDY